MKKIICWLIIGFGVMSVTAYNKQAVPKQSKQNASIETGAVIISEVLSNGSDYYNELILPGNPNGGADWLELYNTTNDTIVIKANQWFITDSFLHPQKFALPPMLLLPNMHQVIWCDGMDTTLTQIHSNFKLNKRGERLALYYKNTNQTLTQVNSITFGSIKARQSLVRKHAHAVATKCKKPTPGYSI
ncbi:MAG: lamin tail domain-containing protein [Bacteroidia bacterium]|nr:lamin tail domain-containing protein [Bacteroidia bacterium]HQV01756.1 lamin tail domain-containing protein [Bacteroidia bacterium]